MEGNDQDLQYQHFFIVWIQWGTVFLLSKMRDRRKRFLTCEQLVSCGHTSSLRHPKYIRFMKAIKTRVDNDRPGPLMPIQNSKLSLLNKIMTFWIILVTLHKKSKRISNLLFPPNITGMLNEVKMSRYAWERVKQIYCTPKEVNSNRQCK